MVYIRCKLCDQSYGWPNADLSEVAVGISAEWVSTFELHSDLGGELHFFTMHAPVNVVVPLFFMRLNQVLPSL